MNNINYRKAIEKDIPKMVELWKEFIDFHKSGNPFFTRSKEGPENFGKFVLENIRKKDANVYVAELNSEVVAYLLASIQNYPPAFEIKSYGLIQDITVTSSFRRQGIGEHLFKIAKEWFKEKRMKRIEIEVAVTNDISTSFWKKMGLKPYKETCYLEL